MIPFFHLLCNLVHFYQIHTIFPHHYILYLQTTYSLHTYLHTQHFILVLYCIIRCFLMSDDLGTQFRHCPVTDPDLFGTMGLTLVRPQLTQVRPGSSHHWPVMSQVSWYDSQYPSIFTFWYFHSDADLLWCMVPTRCLTWAHTIVHAQCSIFVKSILLATPLFRNA